LVTEADCRQPDLPKLAGQASPPGGNTVRFQVLFTTSAMPV
jgi:hypothetical protein